MKVNTGGATERATPLTGDAAAKNARARGLAKPSPALLDKAMACGAVLTGKPDGSESITVVFSIKAWRAFDAALRQRFDVPVEWERGDDTPLQA